MELCSQLRTESRPDSADTTAKPSISFAYSLQNRGENSQFNFVRSRSIQFLFIFVQQKEAALLSRLFE